MLCCGHHKIYTKIGALFAIQNFVCCKLSYRLNEPNRKWRWVYFISVCLWLLLLQWKHSLSRFAFVHLKRFAWLQNSGALISDSIAYRLDKHKTYSIVHDCFDATCFYFYSFTIFLSNLSITLLLILLIFNVFMIFVLSFRLLNQNTIDFYCWSLSLFSLFALFFFLHLTLTLFLHLSYFSFSILLPSAQSHSLFLSNTISVYSSIVQCII